MLTQTLIGTILMLVTVIIHSIGTSIALRWIIAMHRNRPHRTSIVQRSLIVGAVVIIMFVATLFESSIWAWTYTFVDAISEFEKALYFSTVTYTTLGYGDIVLRDEWRLLSAIQAANGAIIFGWTTALIIIAIKDVSQRLAELHQLD